MLRLWLSYSITPKNKLVWATFVGIAVTLLYGVVGWYALALHPKVLPLTPLDLSIPFLPESFWIYFSVNFIYIATCLVQNDLDEMHTFLSAYLLAYATSVVIFLLFPTTFPRELYPLDSTFGLHGRALAVFRTLDQPTNCLPSMHVASSVMCTLPLRRSRPQLFWFFAAWALLITLSTLTTKQHYVIDLYAGAALGAGCYLVVHRLKIGAGAAPKTTAI